jgi:catechol 2,3-dioxygenase-like lactoylglutathione lyase family enzyme
MEKRPGEPPPTVGRMAIALQYCHVTVNDPDESLGFYRDALGLEVGVLPMIIFSVDDLDATFEKVRASGAEVLQEPIDQPWGPRDCAFRDPSGNLVRISQGSAT